VGMRVEELSSGRVLYGWRSGALMDPASNQKLLATATALLRLGGDYRFRTEVTGPAPDGAGVIDGDIVMRGNGDPSLRLRHLDAMAAALARRGVTSVQGRVLADARRIGSDEADVGERPPLRVGAASVEIHVRPGKLGGRPSVSIHPAAEAFVVVNKAETRARGRSRLQAQIQYVAGHYQVVVTGRISVARGEVVLRRAPPRSALFAAVLFRQAMVQAGITVRGGVGNYAPNDDDRVAATPLDGALVALAQGSGDTVPPLGGPADDPTEVPPTDLLALHESSPLPILLRRINKKSDNEWAERVLEATGAELLGGPATSTKGVRVLRDAMSELGLEPGSFVPANGSGLGHHNRVTAAMITALLRRFYYDPRIGPDIMQSLSVGGVDGTTRNRFRGSSAAHQVRAKTGTLNGVSCLSGFVGDGSEVLAFSILVEGHRRRSVGRVRAAQVSAVNAMMQFARNAANAQSDETAAPDVDYENGDDVEDERDVVTPLQEGAPAVAPSAPSDGAHSVNEAPIRPAHETSKPADRP
jgi:D-alanyl-D-alanine carboxypeptidase/D-alanyl-D-alanine-endopeptidase (penicillin-binding protein 4)